MGVKKRQGILNAPLLLNPQTCAQLQEFQQSAESDDDSCLKKIATLLLETKDTDDGLKHVTNLKQVVELLKQSHDNDGSPGSVNSTTRKILPILSSIFCMCGGHRTAIRRTLINLFQCLEFPIVIWCLGTAVVDLLELCKQTGTYSTTLDVLSGFYENFALGEQCMFAVSAQVLVCLDQCLTQSLQLMSASSSHAEQTVAVSNWMSSLKLLMSLLQRSYSKTVEERDVTVLRNILQLIIKSLKIEAYPLDCHLLSGMSLPVITRLVYPDLFLPAVVRAFSNDSAAFQDLGGILTELESVCSDKAKICLCKGLAAQLQTDELMFETSGGTVLVTILFPYIMEQTIKAVESSLKITTSRALVTWTTRAKECISSDESRQKLEVHLNGHSEIMTALLEWVWNNWESAVDVVRHNTAVVFEDIVSIHIIATEEAPSTSSFLQELMTKVFAVPWCVKGKYAALSAIIDHVTPDVVLQFSPTIVQELLQHIGEQQLGAHVSELMLKLCTNTQLRAASEEQLSEWQKTWISPVLHTLSDGTRSQRRAIVEHLLGKLLKRHPDCLTFIVAKLNSASSQSSMSSDSLRTLITCLRKGRGLGLIKATSTPGGDRWNDVLSMDVLRSALCHHQCEVRLDSFALVVNSLKTTEVITRSDFQLIIHFLTFNMNIRSGSFRQQLCAEMKKLLIRFRESGAVLEKKSKWQLKTPISENDNEIATARTNHQTYRQFTSWLFKFLFENLTPSSSFPRRTTSLQILTLMDTIIDLFSDNVFFPATELTSSRVQTLIECLADSYDVNKLLAFETLRKCPSTLLGFANLQRLAKFLQGAIDLAESNKPQHSATAAYLLRLLSTCEKLSETISRDSSHNHFIVNFDSREDIFNQSDGMAAVLRNVLGDFDVLSCGTSTSAKKLSLETQHLLLMGLLLDKLREHLTVAKADLLEASVTHPLYGLIHCIRAVLSDFNVSKFEKLEKWRQLIEDLISTCFSVARVVAPIVTSNSPEGYFPLDSDAFDDDPDYDTSGSATKVVTPQMLLVCCWRTMKEISLLLGLMAKKLPLITAEDDKSNSVLSVRQVKEIGEYFTMQLLESRHRGAFEVAYEGFSQLCHMLWRCPLKELHCLPVSWLQSTLDDIRSDDPNSRLCATRRSAGIPFYILAILTTEPEVSGHACLKRTMADLMSLTLHGEEVFDTTACVHALFILRAIYRCCQLGEEILAFADDGLKVAILGFQAKSWAVRNASTLLFTSLMTRIFGVKRSKDETAIKNCLTVKVFFGRYPSLYSFFLNKLQDCTADIDRPGILHLQPCLYPLLMVMSRLYPSPLESSEVLIDHAALLSLIERCAHSPVLNSRMMAAKAVVNLTSLDQIQSSLYKQISKLPVDKQMTGISQNFLHGILLQITLLVKHLTEQKRCLNVDALHEMERRFCLSSRENVCYVTRAAFLNLVVGILNSDGIKNQKHFTESMHGNLRRLIECEIPLLSSDARCETPGLTQFRVKMVEAYLHIFCLLAQKEDSQYFCCDRNLVCMLLKSQYYEVRLQTLESLSLYIELCRTKSELDENCTNICSDVYETLVDTCKWEFYPSCLAKVYRLLASIVSMDVHIKLRRTKAVDVLKSFVEPSDTWKFEDVSSAQLCLGSALLPFMYNEDSGKAEEDVKWIKKLVTWILEAANVNLACKTEVAQMIAMHAKLLLIDPQSIFEELTFELWHCAYCLLQDDDTTVKEMVAHVVHQFQPDLMIMQPERAVPLLLESMVTIYSDKDICGCIKTHLSWLEKVDSTPDRRAESETELFAETEEMFISAEEKFFTINLITNSLESAFAVASSQIKKLSSTQAKETLSSSEISHIENLQKTLRCIVQKEVVKLVTNHDSALTKMSFLTDSAFESRLLLLYKDLKVLSVLQPYEHYLNTNMMAGFSLIHDCVLRNSKLKYPNVLLDTVRKMTAKGMASVWGF